MLLINLSCYQASECEELQETIAHLKEQLSQALEANELLSESIILQQKTGIGREVGLQVRNEKPLSRDVSEELLERTLQVCLFSALWSSIVSFQCKSN